MNWIRLSSEYPRHRKTLRLVRLLGPVAAVYPIYLWLWAVEQSPDGSLQDLEAEEVAAIVGFDGDPKELWKALTKCGFVEEVDGERQLRSWHEHQGMMIERRERNAERMRRARAAHVQSTSEATNETYVTNETNVTNERKGRVPAPPPEEYPLPDSLATPEFVDAWTSWHQYRSERRLPAWKPRTIAAKFAELAEIGPTRAIAAIRHSIANGYQGIFEPKGGGVPASRPAISATTTTPAKDDPNVRRVRAN